METERRHVDTVFWVFEAYLNDYHDFRCEEILFQQNGAPAYTAGSCARDVLKPLDLVLWYWPACSPDVTYCDIFLWSFPLAEKLKQPITLEELKTAIQEEIVAIQPTGKSEAELANKFKRV